MAKPIEGHGVTFDIKPGSETPITLVFPQDDQDPVELILNPDQSQAFVDKLNERADDCWGISPLSFFPGFSRSNLTRDNSGGRPWVRLHLLDNQGVCVDRGRFHPDIAREVIRQSGLHPSPLPNPRP